MILALLAGCATPAASAPSSGAPLGAAWPAPPEGEVIATGTVMDVDGAVELCLGPIMESYPPQCDGIPLSGWAWDGVEGSETSGATTWGAYAVYGTYDGETFTNTRPPIMLALFDPIAREDPTGGVPGASNDATLTAIADELPAQLGAGYLTSSPQNGYLWVSVLWDDGTWQDAVDAEYGPGVVVISSAIWPFE